MSKKTNPEASGSSAKVKKQPGAGAAFASVLLFILLLLLSVLLFCSMSVHTALKHDAIPAAIDQLALEDADVTDGGKTQSFGSWLHECYMWNSENLTPAYGEALSARPEFRAYFSDYAEELGDYLLKERSILPELDAAALCDTLQYDIAADMQSETGILFAEADRSAILYNAEDDMADFNEAIYDIVGHGFGKGVIRFFCTLPGVITAAVLTVVCFLLWLIFAIRGSWRKGRMLTASGIAAAIPSLLLLLCGGVLLLLVCVFDCISTLSFASNALPTLLQPFLWCAAILGLCGVLIASVGICTNSVVKSRKKRALAAAELPTPEMPVQPDVPQAAEQTDFTYSQMQTQPEPAPVPVPSAPQSASPSEPAPAPAPAAGRCPHCGAENTPGSKFCGSCGGSISM